MADADWDTQRKRFEVTENSRCYNQIRYVLKEQLLTILILEKLMSPFSLLLGVPSSMNAKSVK